MTDLLKLPCLYLSPYMLYKTTGLILTNQLESIRMFAKCRCEFSLGTKNKAALSLTLVIVVNVFRARMTRLKTFLV